MVIYNNNIKVGESFTLVCNTPAKAPIITGCLVSRVGKDFIDVVFEGGTITFNLKDEEIVQEGVTYSLWRGKKIYTDHLEHTKLFDIIKTKYFSENSTHTITLSQLKEFSKILKLWS